MRLRGWLIVGISMLLVAAAGAVGFSVNRSAMRAADTVHRADSAALATNNAALAGQLQLLYAKELLDFAGTTTLGLRAGDPADRTALVGLAARSSYFSYAVALTGLNGEPLNASVAAAALPAASDPGYGPLRVSLRAATAGFSSVMTVGTTALQAVAIPLVVKGAPSAVLVGFVDVARSQLQAYLLRLSSANLVTAVVDTAGRVAATNRVELLNTVLHPAIVKNLGAAGAGPPRFLDYRLAGEPMIALVAGGMPGGWSYLRIYTVAAFDGPIHSRSQTINIALLVMLVVAAVGLAVLGHRSGVIRQRAEQRFQALVQHAPDLVTVVDADGRMIYSSPGGERILGFPHQSLLGLSVFDLLHPDDQAATRERFTALVTDRDRVDRLECRVRAADGEHRWFDLTASNQLHNPALAGIVINARDISDSRTLRDRLAHDAEHDPLTGLPNRRHLEERLADSLTGTEAAVAVLFVDLDGFKPVNDELGHDAGDALLREVGDRLSGCLRQGDVLARVGGDEFVLLLPGISTTEEVDAVTERIRTIIGEPFVIADQTVCIGASVGVHLAGPAERPDDVLRAADQAMYVVKRAVGRSGRHRR